MLYLSVCVVLFGMVAAEFDPDLHAMYRKMPKSSFIEYFNKQNYTWTITDYNKKYSTCLLHVDLKLFHSLPMVIHDLKDIKLPENFDSREKWPQCTTIKEIYDQGHCGSCWTFGTATTASDRTCIHINKIVRLAEQDFECLQTDVCGGGFPDKAFDFWKQTGLVTQECKPYDIKKLLQNKCETSCVNTSINYENDKHFAEKVYGVAKDTDQIKAELEKNGPIQASFAVFQDFHDYKEGIYEHKYGGLIGYHSVRMIGYGVENRVDYWLVANSWSTKWGESGLFKIKINQQEVGIEDELITGLPKN